MYALDYGRDFGLAASDEVLIDGAVVKMIDAGRLPRGGTLDADQWRTLILEVMRVLAGTTARVLNTAELAQYLQGVSAARPRFWLGAGLPTLPITIPATTQAGPPVTRTSYEPGAAQEDADVADIPPPSLGGATTLIVVAIVAVLVVLTVTGTR